MKRIVTVQDLSCLGRCSLAVAMPVISAMGVECCAIPTAVLSTHTMFSRATVRDLTDEIPGILEHWQQEGFSFDAVYTGYLSSPAQVELMLELLRRFRGEDTLAVVDPVMGDHGRLYAGMDEALPERLRELSARADVVLPNLTEASLLLGVEYREDCDRDHIRLLLKKLTALGARCAIMTGVSFQPGSIGAVGYCAAEDTFFEYFTEKEEISCHGTGDLFASALTGALVQGLPMERAMALAVDYVKQCLCLARQDRQGPGRGVPFEKAMGWLVRRMEQETNA